VTWSAIRNVIAIWVGLIAIVAIGAVAGTLARSGDAEGRATPVGGPAGSHIGAPPVPTSGPTPHANRDGRGGFLHPGVLVSARQLDFVRDQIGKGEQQWLTAYEEMAISPHASLSWQPKPRAVVDCGPFSTPDLGCRDESSDAVAAYTHALMWYLTGNRAHADKVIQILDAWAAVLKKHTNRNAPLQAAWSAASFVRAAEIVRYTYDGWPKAQLDRTIAMFRTVFLPLVKGGAPQAGGNWELILLDAASGIAVFLDDRPLFEQVLQKTRSRAKTFIYLGTDGKLPRPPTGTPNTKAELVKLWYGQSTFVDGLTQETCRDFGHTAWGFAALAHIAETAWLQGVDLYAELRVRLVTALEFHVPYEQGRAVPAWLCGGKVELGLRPIPEVAYHHYAFRMKLLMPRTGVYVESKRPEGASFFYGWETLTHAGNPF